MGAILHLPKRDVPIAVTAMGKRLVITGESNIRFELSIAATTLKQLTWDIENSEVVRGRLNITIKNWDWLTPQVVIDYFASSPVLRDHLADVQKVLGPLCIIEEQPFSRREHDLAIIAPLAGDILKANGLPKHGAQSRIAEALGISNSGPSNRNRILAIIEALQTSSSGEMQAGYTGEEDIAA